jgi:glutamyl-Q tRNA(Asp) synthetase
MAEASANFEYRGRFAPSPTGLLHLGSLVAALASWLDARSHQGKWLIRMENIDTPRERPGAMEEQLSQLARFGLQADEPIVYQSDRFAAYESALARLHTGGNTYVCRCSRNALRLSGAGGRPGPDRSGAEPVYPGRCRELGLAPPGAVRLRVAAGVVRFHDRAAGAVEQDVASDVGDFIVRRSDGLWAYQLAVVVDDAAQGITDVVRGADLLDNTPRQILLQCALGLPTPRYLHLPLVRDAQGRKLSKRDAPPAVDGRDALAELERAWSHLGFAPTGADSVPCFLDAAIPRWQARFGMNAATGARVSSGEGGPVLTGEAGLVLRSPPGGAA